MSRTLLTSYSLTKIRLPVSQSSRRVVLTFRGERAIAKNPPTCKSPGLQHQLAAFLQQQQFDQQVSLSSTHPEYLYHHHQTYRKQAAMAFLLPGLRRSLILSTPLLLSAPLLMHQYRHPVRCEGPDPLSKITADLTKNYSSEARTPIITESGTANPQAIRQVSMGSILGVLGGLGISVFSKPLAILIGLGIFVLQFIESRGIHVIPYSFLQRRFKQTNVRSLIRDNAAFKLSFGLTFALAAFAEF
ncbi:hypothetical protein FB567DRAFT_525698 [Paraphoma chrysanthemicola]|uniref:Uncharacterized protein n=1 Tax=Paraphoma chrysanthemicola TaxID=798071 RepID=A0A8K0VYE2_9PLEO|nr:hypothetical protein FB567DRAFT_525698 [Paraphoma chrysanthemicola]